METDQDQDSAGTNEIEVLAGEIIRYGREMGLPYNAVSADISDPDPMLGCDGRPLAETLFQWVDPQLAYWKDRGFALRSGLVHATRTMAEPFYFSEGGVVQSWRSSSSKLEFDLVGESADHSVRASIVCPCHLPFGVIGAVVWASDKKIENLAEIFDAYVDKLFVLTFKFICTYREEAFARLPHMGPELTRREIQCLKWAAAGKTDSEIAVIVGISSPTVRFHLTNASRKLDVTGRSQAIHMATKLGYVGRIRS